VFIINGCFSNAMADSEEVNCTIEYLTVGMICLKKNMSLKSCSTVFSVPKSKCEYNV
jgi:ribonuclease I